MPPHQTENYNANADNPCGIGQNKNTLTTMMSLTKQEDNNENGSSNGKDDGESPGPGQGGRNDAYAPSPRSNVHDTVADHHHDGAADGAPSVIGSIFDQPVEVPQCKGTGARPKADKGQKSDKAVEVLKAGRAIACFRSQTECARYLRATPEAVSYHCGKGGGVCNGLDIRPLSMADDRCYGLFDGAELHRPRKRPQLRPEQVDVLKEWLLSPEHRENPYPNQRELLKLMERTGMDKSQLKHWFNNARKRILKPLLSRGGLSMALHLGASRKGDRKATKRTTGETDEVGYTGESSMSASAARRIDDAPLKKKIRSGDASESHRENGTESTAAVICGNTENNNVHGTGNSQQLQEQQILLQQGQQLFEQQQRQLLLNSFSSVVNGNASNNNNNNNSNQINTMSQNQYNQSGAMQLGGMIGNADCIGAMMNGGNTSNSMLNNDGYGGHNGGNLGGGGGMNSKMLTNSYDSFNLSNNNSNIDGNSGHSNNNQSDGHNTIYCQPINDSSGGQPATETTPATDSSARSNAVFKQQVANMAMNEATKAFREMENAFAHAKVVLAASRTKRSRLLLRGLEQGVLNPPVSNPEDDPLVLAAHAHTKKCQSVAMFKLKVSQRASEEAANAYDSYQKMVEERKSGNGNIRHQNEDILRQRKFQDVTGR